MPITFKIKMNKSIIPHFYLNLFMSSYFFMKLNNTQKGTYFHISGWTIGIFFCVDIIMGQNPDSLFYEKEWNLLPTTNHGQCTKHNRSRGLLCWSEKLLNIGKWVVFWLLVDTFQALKWKFLAVFTFCFSWIISLFSKQMLK